MKAIKLYIGLDVHKDSKTASRALEKDCCHAIGTRVMIAISLRSGFQSPNTRRIGDPRAQEQNAREVQKK